MLSRYGLSSMRQTGIEYVDKYSSHPVYPIYHRGIILYRLSFNPVLMHAKSRQKRHTCADDDFLCPVR